MTDGGSSQLPLKVRRRLPALLSHLGPGFILKLWVP
jgi:hypothetical protein